ncbi:hypothetical protein [Vibrio sp. HN007]|uniref:hypothetical protein n=1 Tax=Vibrio iocasae TaxID=3098914 RepID=UPI0035D49610
MKLENQSSIWIEVEIETKPKKAGELRELIYWYDQGYCLSAEQQKAQSFDWAFLIVAER